MNFVQEMVDSEVVVLDIETEVTGKRPSIRDIPKFVGFKAPHGKKRMFHISQHKEIQYVLDYYQVYSGHNIDEYDIPILQKAGFNLNRSKGNRLKKTLDTYQIFMKRAKSMMYLDLSIGQMGLGSLCERFGLESQKGDIDYDVFKKNEWSDEELTEIQHYLFGDLDSSYDLLEYVYTFFYGFKMYMSKKNQNNFSWLTSSAGSTAYKIVCHNANIAEEYNSNITQSDGVQYAGGFVALPFMDRARGHIKCIDWSSLYPHMFMGGGLYNYTEDNDELNELMPNGYVKGNDLIWHGGEIFKPIEEDPLDGIKGYYYRKMGSIEKVIQMLYTDRGKHKTKMKEHEEGSLEYKMYDAMQLATKITINTIYGISGSEIFKNVFNLNTASDCTAMARTSIKQARKRLQENFYIPLYTDSVTGGMEVNIKHNDKVMILTFDEFYEYLREQNYVKDVTDKERIVIDDDLYTLSLDDDRNVVWKRVLNFIRHKTDKQCYQVESSRGDVVEVTEDHSLINLERDTTSQGRRESKYNFVEVKPTEAKKVVILNSMTTLPEKELGYHQFESKVWQMFGYYACKGRYINGKGMHFRRGSWNVPTTHLLNDILKPLTVRYGGSAYRNKRNAILGYGSWWIKQGKKFGEVSTIPEWMVNLPLKFLFPVLRGIYTACGVARREQVTFYLYNDEFKVNLRKLLLRFGLVPKLIIEKGREHFTLDVSISQWFKDNIGAFDRNKSGFLKTTSMVRRFTKPVRKITPMVKEDRFVYDLEVEDTHRFYANNICVHNTDSVYALDPFDDDEKLKDLCKKISIEQQQDMNIPIETHDFEIESDISHMYFFTNDKGEYVKKFYAYAYETSKGLKIKLKGIRLVKGDCSELARTIYKKHIEQNLLEYKEAKYSPEQIFEWVKELFLEDTKRLSKRFRPKDLSEYKVPKGKTEPTSIHYAIAKRYGPGEFMLVPNTAIGPGKDKHYALKEELIEEFGEEWVDYVVLTPIVEELKVFIPWQERKRIKKLQAKPELKMYRDGENIIETRNPIIKRQIQKKEEINRKSFLALKKEGFNVKSIT